MYELGSKLDHYNGPHWAFQYADDRQNCSWQMSTRANRRLRPSIAKFTIWDMVRNIGKHALSLSLLMSLASHMSLSFFSRLSLSLSSHMCVTLFSHTCVFLSSQLFASLLLFSFSLFFLSSLPSDHDNDHLLLSLCSHCSLTLSARVHGYWPTRWWANCSLHAEKICTSVLWCVAVAVAVVCCVLRGVCYVLCVVWCVVRGLWRPFKECHGCSCRLPCARKPPLN